MLRAERQFVLVDLVWAVVHDSRWHTAEEIARRVHSPIERVLFVLTFLEEYGFARSSSFPVRKFRVNPGTPSPSAVVHGLRFLLNEQIWD